MLTVRPPPRVRYAGTACPVWAVESARADQERKSELSLAYAAAEWGDSYGGAAVAATPEGSTDET